MIVVTFDSRFVDHIVKAINNLTDAVNNKGDKIVSAFTDLQQKVVDLGSDLSTQLGNLNTSLQAELTAIQAALAAATSGGTSDADIQTVTDSLTSFQSNLDSGIKAVQTAIDNETASLGPKPPTA